MSQGRFAAIAVAAVVLAFGAAFAIGKASGGGKEKAAAPSAVTPVEVAASTEVTSFSPSGSLPAPKETKEKAPSGDSGGSSTPAPAAPSTPAPSAPAPSAPAPSAPAPSAPSSPPPSSPPPSNPPPSGGS